MFDQLLDRWAAAYEDGPGIDEHRSKAVSMKYNRKECFDLEGYGTADFLKCDGLSERPPAEWWPYYIYGIMADGRPCFSEEVYSEEAKTAGYFNYTDDRVEYVGYGPGLEIPLYVTVVLFGNGRKQSFQQLSLNGAGYGFHGLSVAECRQKILGDDLSSSLFTADYVYEGDRIVRADCYSRQPGLPGYRYEQRYEYDGDGQLLRIRSFQENGSNWLSFSRWDENEGLEGLSDRLAGLIAGNIVDTLIDNRVISPIAILELGYQYAGHYWPHVAYALTAEEKRNAVNGKKGEIWQDLFLPGVMLLTPNHLPIEEPMVQFLRQMEDKHDYGLGTTMLRKAAAILTSTRLLGRIPVDDEFLTFVIDGSVEGHEPGDFKKILLECGFAPELVTAWDERGWLK
jgi:hypothetical protein